MRRTEQFRPLTELETIQNPALGAFLIWRVGLEFQKEEGRAFPLHLTFIILPLLLHKHTLDLIGSTQKRSGLSLLVAKLADQRENLLAVHERAMALRILTLKSIGVGLSTKLFTLNYIDATLRANTPDENVGKPQTPERLKSTINASDKLGYWFSKLGINQIAVSLMVEF